ncbi:MAG: putative dipeptidyl peptidase 1 precursor, partial [Streblomastix strix]
VIKPQNYSCFVATKDSSSQKHSHQSTLLSQVVRIRQQDSDGVRQQSKDYEKIVTPVQPVPSDPRHIAQFPSSLDWSNYSNFDYVEPVQNQGECGSCYAFATLGMMEARYSLALNKTVDVSLSVQDIVSCSYYTQGCFGGHGSTTSQWMRDHGIVSEKCFPYQQIEVYSPEVKCSTKLCGEAGIDKDRHTFYAQNIRYVGGFYGNCSEEA